MSEAEENLYDDGVDDNPVRGTVQLTPAEKEAREREKAQILGSITRESSGPRSRRIRPGQERDYPDQIAQHQAAPPTAEELAAERSAPAPSVTRVPGERSTIEVLAARVRESEERLKEDKAALKKALKRLGVK